MRRDPVELEIFKNLYHSIAEEMGAALRRTAFSPNIKERRDYSCAVFDGAGEVIAMGDHMPVHLGSMPMSVRAAIDAGADGTGRRGDAQRSISRRDAFARHYPRRARLCGEAGTPREESPRTNLSLTSTWLRGRIMRMWEERIRDRWGFAAKFTRKAFASRR